MSPLRVLRGFVFGALGGAIGWMLVEFLPLGYPFQPARWEAPGVTPPQSYPYHQGLLGAALGFAIGALLGVSEGIGEGTTSRFRRAFFTFAILGTVGGFVGLYFGQQVYGSLGGKVDVQQISAAEFFPQLLARSLAWMFIGFFLGIVFGVPNLSTRRMWNGAVGGAIGGFLGGFVFQVLVFTRQFQGMQVRLLGFIIIGAAIGFFINLIAEAMKRVWVKVLIGRNEGREYVLDTPVAYVGRDELADVPVFTDPMVPKRMASFRLTGGRYALNAESPNLPITVNGEPLVPGRVLRDGDAIQFGRVTLGYYEKATATGYQRPIDTVQLAEYNPNAVLPGTAPIPQAPGVCEFCGTPRDASGACACSVGAAPAYPSMDPGGYASPGGYPDPGGYGAPSYDTAYAPAAPMADYGAPPAYPAPDPAYAATMMDPGMGAYAPGADGGSGPRLTVISGPYAGQVFPLVYAEAGIGRDPGQEISLAGDSTASRRHARLVSTGSGWMVRDEGSSNGTWVNGVRISEQHLFPGDTVRVGASQFRFDL